MAFDEVKRSAFLELTFRGPVYATLPLGAGHRAWKMKLDDDI